jgi:phage/plasmid-associated DNA primase
MGVGNGILKLGSKAELIEGYNEYRVSKYTDTVYVEFDPANHYIAKTLDIIQQIIPEPDVLEYVMMFLSTGLDGRAAAPLMLMLDGGGANGKTTLFEWVRNTLGSYGYKAPMNLLTDAREKGASANSAFIGLKDMRLAVYSEADDVEGEIFVNGGRFKEMISPEIQSGRDLHQRQENFKITATQVVAFNKRLSFRSNDHAIWRRVRYYKCKVKFCSDPDPNNRYEQKEDSRIAEQYPLDPYYRSAMMAILVHYNERLRREYGGNIKLVPCHTIDVETEEYRNTQDTLNLYITQMMVVPVGEPLFEDQMHGNTFEYPLHVVLASYKKWYVERKGREAPECGVEIFDSSRMAKYIRRDINGAQMLVGLRIRESLNENLRADEKFLINLVPIRVNEVAEFARARPQEINIVRGVADDIDEYANLERGNIGPIVDVKNIVQLGIFNEGDDDDDDFI